MAVDDFLSRDTDAFVLPSTSYYPLKIPIAHYQLRHFISSPEQDLIYYASAEDIYCLNAATRTQAHVTTLPWAARCMAAGHGYVCVAGHTHGNFAAIKVEGFPPADPADVDAPSRTTLPRPPRLGTAHRIRMEKIGSDIVNSISIHKFPAEGDGEDEVVAVLTNNDKTVRIYSLTSNLEVTCLDFGFPMNHATISPDGQLLAAVGDQHTGYFYQRVKKARPSTMKTPEGRLQTLVPEWRLLHEINLYLPAGACLEGYFTTAWSPSGRLCALGSECGYITVLDVERLMSCEYGEDAIVHLICSSKPDNNVGPGSVRTMQFSPAPWDLLVWSEDQARVCVADVRTGLKVRQVLSLDPKEEDMERVEIADFDLTLSPEMQDLRREADFIRRYRRALDSEGTAAAVNFATDYIEASSERRRLHRQLGVVESDNDPHGLTAHERQVLEALRTTRQRDEAREQIRAPRSINYTRSWFNETTRQESEAAARWFPETTRQEREAAARRNMTESLTESMLNQLQMRTAPRRQTSVVIESGGSGSTVDTFTTGNAPNITDAATTRSPNPIPEHARRVDPQIISSTDEAWRTIEEALAHNARAADNVRNSGELRTELRRIRQLTQVRERLRNVREAQPLESYGLGSMGAYRRPMRGTAHDPANGVRTAGLAMSQDGRMLYCGTEEGIFEFRINVHERKGKPAVTPC